MLRRKALPPLKPLNKRYAPLINKINQSQQVLWIFPLNRGDALSIQVTKDSDYCVACLPHILLQTQAILDTRIEEEHHITLSISVYDVARNETARTHRKEQEAKLAEEERIRKEKEMDYLAPFLAHIGDPSELTKRQMEEVTQVSSDCHLSYYARA